MAAAVARWRVGGDAAGGDADFSVSSVTVPYAGSGRQGEGGSGGECVCVGGAVRGSARSKITAVWVYTVQ